MFEIRGIAVSRRYQFFSCDTNSLNHGIHPRYQDTEEEIEEEEEEIVEECSDDEEDEFSFEWSSCESSDDDCLEEEVEDLPVP